jgi:hypothetical protein
MNNKFNIDALLVYDEYFDLELSFSQDDLINNNLDISSINNNLTVCQLYSTAQIGNLDITINDFGGCTFNDFK